MKTAVTIKHTNTMIIVSLNMLQQISDKYIIIIHVCNMQASRCVCTPDNNIAYNMYVT